MQLAYTLKLPPEAFKAWSQNLGHEDALTTFTSYGTLPVHRQGEVMRGIEERRKIASKDIAAAIATLAGLQQARVALPEMLRGASKALASGGVPI